MLTRNPLRATAEVYRKTNESIIKSRLRQYLPPTVMFQSKVKIRAYPKGKSFENGDDFKETFTKVVGYFGAKGKDLPKKELNQLLFKE